jgi:hypothetical protein|eukprot:COSAG06_NODE_3325_length_5502_cov_15.729513_4_plen_402_part_00
MLLAELLLVPLLAAAPAAPSSSGSSSSSRWSPRRDTAPLPPSLDDLWAGNASFKLLRSTPLSAPGFAHVDAGTRVVVSNGTWYLFGRWDQGPSKKCPQRISINVRASTDKGQTWGAPHVVAEPDETTVCVFADGSAIYDAETTTWHYVVQMLDVSGKGGWMGAHFSLTGSASPFGDWVSDANNPVVASGSLWGEICAGTGAATKRPQFPSPTWSVPSLSRQTFVYAFQSSSSKRKVVFRPAGKHCQIGMVDEGTFDIVEKSGGYFYVTFHGYDYKRRLAARGVARTADFQHWDTRGGDLPGDAIFAAADCEGWNVSWTGGCIGSGKETAVLLSAFYIRMIILTRQARDKHRQNLKQNTYCAGEASILRAPSGYMYEVIEATDLQLGTKKHSCFVFTSVCLS